MKHWSSLNKYFFKDRKSLYIILSIMMLSVLTLTVVYAALSTTLNINGTSEVTAASWDIYLDNIQLNSSSVTSNVPTITDKTTASFSTTLSKPGDYYMFTVDIVNNGSIDAMIDSVTKTPELSETQKKYLNYVVEYQNGESITTKQLVEKNSFVRLKVKVEFRKDISALDLPTASETLNLSFKVNYVQSDDSSENVSIDNNGKLVKVVSGDLNTVGSEVCIGSECFYVISSDDESVAMLAKYNLYVGGIYDSSYNWTAYGDEATGVQHSTMIGRLVDDGYPRNGITVFSDDLHKGINYSDYDGSLVEVYVNNYSLYLKTLGVNILESRLILKEELEILNCSSGDKTCGDAPAFVYSTSYWVGTAYDANYLWRVSSDSYFDYGIYNGTWFCGVRPVIIVSKSLF